GSITADGNDVARFTAGAVDVTNAGTKFTVTEGEKTADGVATHSVTVTLVDKDGNPVLNADVSKLTASSDPANASFGEWVNNGDGTYTATVTS
ncbi:Ig-like domain-containing protein, partial [Escherichia coli]|nr:Ig-like domain-containing protein [Escherichia coli]